MNEINFLNEWKKRPKWNEKSRTCPSLVSNAYLQHSGSHLPSFPGILDKLYNSWTIHIKQFGFNSLLDLKGVTGNVWSLNWICNIVDKVFRIYLRHIKRFYDVYLLNLSATSMLIISFFFKFLNNDDKKYDENCTVN